MSFRSPEQLSRDEPSLVRQERTFNKRTVQEWLAGAVAKLEDAQRSANSGPTRMDAAYDVLLYCALALFASRGFRITSSPGHHVVALEGMAHLLNLSQSVFDEMDAVREWRNRKYSAAFFVNDQDVKDAIDCARQSLSRTESWFQHNHPDILRA